MIFVFVIDTSPTMTRPAAGDSGMSRLDVAKMVVEDLSRQLRKRHSEHTRLLMQDADPALQKSIVNLGQKGNLNGGDAFLLLTTSRQYPDTSTCGAAGRLLVGFGPRFLADSTNTMQTEQSSVVDGSGVQRHELIESFQRELKRLVAAEWDGNSPFPVDGGGAVGLNAALSSGLQLLSRYRLHNRLTENFGMGRLPNVAISTSNGAPAAAALQPACLILVTDGACLRQPPKLGGGTLQLQFGSQPLREFYTEPFRWDQRIFCLGVGGREGVTSSQYLHPQLRALCEVTGGSHWMVRSSANLQGITEALVRRIRPALPRELPIPDPLFLRIQQPSIQAPNIIQTAPGSCFVNGGPVCTFQSFEVEEGSGAALRAMMLYTGSHATMQSLQSNTADPPQCIGPPLYFIPEAFFPNKKLDTLPPRMAQPFLYFSKVPSNLGSKSFEPTTIIKMLHRLDQLIASNRKLVGQPARLLQRDVYVCEWLGQEGGSPVQVSVSSKLEYFPVFCRGAGRPSLSDDADSALNIGILHVPLQSSTIASQAGPGRLATLTLLPPEPHVLLPLLLRAAENEHKALKKAELALLKRGDIEQSLIHKQIAAKALVVLDEQWKNEFRAYQFRLPPYYSYSLKRSLRHVLPSVAHSLLPADTTETVAMQCFSKSCMLKIRNGEQGSRDMIERQERQEASLRQRNVAMEQNSERFNSPRYGQFDARGSVDSYLAALRTMPPPWQVGTCRQQDGGKGHETKSDATSVIGEDESRSPKSVVEILGDLPQSCLLAYYESRRRWLFGGPNLLTQGLHVEGVSNGGSNCQRYGSSVGETDECILTVGKVGASTLNRTTTTKMGDYRERLVFSRSPVVGYGSNDAAGVAATTAVDGSPVWSVDDDALPVAFFDTKTGEFADSVQTRIRSKLMVNFGNPYKEKRADSLVPEKFLSQAPSMQQGGIGSLIGSSRSSCGSPPHDSFDSVEEGEAVFVRKSPSRSPKRDEPDDPDPSPSVKVARLETESRRAESNTLPEVPRETSTLPQTNAPSIPPPIAPAISVSGNPKVPASPTKSSPLPKHPPIHSGISTKKAPQPPPRPPPPKPPGVAPKRTSLKAPPPPGPPPQLQANTIRSEQSNVQNEGTQIRVIQQAESSGPGQAKVPIERKLIEREDSNSSIGSTMQNLSLQSSKMIRTESDASVSSQGQQLQMTSRPPVPPYIALNLLNPDKKPDVDLPAGWICSWSKSQKRWYFFDTRTNKSVWNWPPN
ncbi:ATP-dependent RNA helicase DDX26B [Fistulifera solaris]|uniref:ATP-dependent RNA helicase DDX26B n=1 Tax=Fistulifera solaris TaxID=1519565 RepID=A0A1Z5JKA4_FISSO|nr:ATP-dependent RNA helicase DDX26B [Fistulifera solaris]|eukprot:GAX14282.1 ATP-dependent RNA helicase DDX26B [Fistulifera solaris]